MLIQPPIKYVICPGNIPSKFDKDTHFINAQDLAQLYGVRLSDCLVIESGKEVPKEYHKIPWLVPRYHGDYEKLAIELGIHD